MNYYINIIDTVNSNYTTLLETAKKRSIILSYKGKDEKDALSIVGSTLKYVIIVKAIDNVDGALDHLLTGDEKRYKIELRREGDDLLIWQGFNLPDQYSEPYKAGTLPISFTATDGLGRLKGKFLPDIFYTEEHSVTEILAACLKLTGLNMPFYFAPAIENSNQNNYDSIFISGDDLKDDDDPEDAYTVLKYFAEDLLFCVFQQLGYWHLEGLNKRNLISFDAKEYDVDGVYIQDVTINRSVKDVNGITLKNPNVTAVVPYGIIRVNYNKQEISLPSTVSTEINEGWTVTTSVTADIYALEWIGNFYPRATDPDYKIWFYLNFTTGVFDASRFVTLLKKLYLSAQQKIKITLDFEVIDTFINQENNDVTEWDNPIYYDVLFNDDVIFSNRGNDVSDKEQLQFDQSKKVSLKFEYVAPFNGLLDLKIYEPVGDGFSELRAVALTGAAVDPIKAIKTETFTDVINEEYTTVKDKSITFSDDAGAYGKSFRLQKLNQNAAEFNSIDVPILYSFTQLGRYYSAVSLSGANLIDENRLTVTNDSAPGLEVLDVIYNFSAGEAMLIETNTPDLTGVFVVKQFYKITPPANRSTWQQWADTMYNVEQLRFAEIHALIFRRLFKVPHVKIDMDVKGVPFLYNDLVKFNYKGQANYTISNLRSWDIDKGVTKLIVNKAIYQNNDGGVTEENLPPFVNAGADIFIGEDDTTVNLTASADDPDGFIASWLWSQITSFAGVSFSTPNTNTTLVSGLTEDFYTFQILVTDNEGATAIDQVNVIRLKEYDLQINLDNETVINLPDEESFDALYNVITVPNLVDGVNLSISGVYTITLGAGLPVDQAAALLQLVKNTVTLIDENITIDQVNGLAYEVTTPFTFSLNSTDVVTLRLFVEAARGDDFSQCGATITFKVLEVNVVTGTANIITPLPLEVTKTAQA
jgi:hypothetical protein